MIISVKFNKNLPIKFISFGLLAWYMVDESLVFGALVDWNLWGNFRKEVRSRECDVKLPTRNLILTIKGVRRCGKSFLSYLLAKNFSANETLFLNFEDPRLTNLSSDDILRVVEVYQRKVNPSLPRLIVLDEVQNVGGWENVARLFVDAKDVKVIATGSSSKLMSEEYATVLTGRHIDVEIFPLSFREILSWNSIGLSEVEVYKSMPKVLYLFEEYLNYGGFPEIVLSGDKGEKVDLLRNYFSDIIVKDIVRRFRVREIEKIENLARIYLTNISTLQSFNKLKGIIRLSLDSVERFSRYMETARLFLFLPKFSSSLAQQILAPKKVYCIDNGFFSALGFKVSENFGKLMENLVAIELFRRKNYWFKNLEIFYWRDYQQREVDFVVKEGNYVKQLIQVTYASGKDEVERREVESLKKASNELGCKNLMIITWTYEDIFLFDDKTIVFKPLWKWLLQKEL